MAEKEKVERIDREVALGLVQEDLRLFQQAGGVVQVAQRTLPTGAPVVVVALAGVVLQETPEGARLAMSGQEAQDEAA